MISHLRRRRLQCHRMTYRNAVFGACALGVCALAIMTIWAQSRLRMRVYASGLSSPVAFVQDPLDARCAVRRRTGRTDPRGARAARCWRTDFLDLRAAVLAGGERGLLGLAFAPNAASGRFFVNFTDRSGDTVVARFRRSSDPLVADPASRFDLRFGGPGGAAAIAQPFANHNGGHLAFGPDGYLYIGLGDGGSGDDPDHRAQNPQELLGKMLRIDVNVPDTHATGYQVPADQPVRRRPADCGAAGDLGVRPAQSVALQLRRSRRAAAPARSSSATSGRTRSRRSTTSRPNRGGRNYGWRNREGAHDNVTSRPPAFLPLVDPIHEYGRAVGAVRHRRIRLPRPGARCGLRRALLLRRLRAGPRLVARAGDRRPGRSARVGRDRAHGGTRRPESARQRQLVRRRRRRRAVYRQPLARGRAERRRPRTSNADRFEGDTVASGFQLPAPSYSALSRTSEKLRSDWISSRLLKK